MVKIALLLIWVPILLTSCGAPGKGELWDEEGLTIAIKEDIATLKPWGHNLIITSYATRALYDTLFRPDSQGNPEMLLLSDYEYLSETELYLRLHQGVKFHDGSELRAEDVKASLDAARQDDSEVKHLFGSISEIEVLGDYELIIRTFYPYAPLLGSLAHSGAGIAPKALAESGDFSAPIGSGAYKLVEWVPGEAVRFVRNEDYYFPQELSPWESLTLRVILEGSNRTVALESGEVDMITHLEPLDMDRIEAAPGLTALIYPSNNINYLVFNTEVAPFDNRAVRLAVSYALNKEEIIAKVTNGLGTPLQSLTPPNILGYSDVVSYSYAPEKGRTLLGYSSYERTPVVLLASGDVRERIARIIQKNLRVIGLESEVQVMDWVSYLKATREGDYQFALIGWTTVSEPDRFLTPLLHSKSINGQNRARYANSYVDALLEEGVAVLEPGVREDLYKRVYKTVMEDAPWVPLYSSDILMAGRSDLQYEGSITSGGSVFFNFIKRKETDTEP